MEGLCALNVHQQVHLKAPYHTIQLDQPCSHTVHQTARTGSGTNQTAFAVLHGAKYESNLTTDST